MIRLISKLELIPIIAGGLTGVFFSELGTKIVITTLAMVVGTTISYYWKKYLIRKNKKK
tara:strand:- start:3966 stop:4142 length:177 start_codon:yes stop_codon:yes gene_type:complete